MVDLAGGIFVGYSAGAEPIHIQSHLVGEALRADRIHDYEKTRNQIHHMLRYYIGLDVHKNSVSVGYACSDGSAPEYYGKLGGSNQDATLTATRTLLALKAYKQDTGWLPGSLAELVPDYLRESPSDPFDGRPLRYAPLKNIVYSIGADLVDRGGSDRENPVSARQDKNEPTFQIEF